MFIFPSSFIYSVLDIKNGPLGKLHFVHFPWFGNPLIKIMKKACKKNMFWKYQNKTRKCRTLNILGHLFSVVLRRCWLHTQSFKWCESAGREHDFSTLTGDKAFNKTHLFPIYCHRRTHRTFITATRREDEEKEREGWSVRHSWACFSNWSEERLQYCISLRLGWKQATTDFFSFFFWPRCSSNATISGLELKNITGVSCVIKECQHNTMCLERNTGE